MSETWMDTAEQEMPERVKDWVAEWERHKAEGCPGGEECVVTQAAKKAGDDARFGIWLVLALTILDDNNYRIDDDTLAWEWRESFDTGIAPDDAAFLAAHGIALLVVDLTNFDKSVEDEIKRRLNGDPTITEGDT